MRLLAVLTLLALFAAAFLLGDGRVRATGFTVDSTLDAIDAAPGDGACRTIGGFCTLRAAVQEANALEGTDTISLPAGVYMLTLPGIDEDAAVSGDLDINSNMTITGAGAPSTVIDGAGLDRVFQIHATGYVSISGLTIRNGAEAVAGGILNNGTVLFTDGVMSGNTTLDDGGAVINHGTFIGTRSTFSGNYSGDNGGAFWGDGTLELVDSTLAGNTAHDEGGAIVSFGGNVTLTRSTVSGNHALTIRGGGLVNFGESTMTLTNVTVSGNDAATLGGGILNNGTMTVSYSTIAFNTSASGGGLHNGGSLTIGGTIISNNTPDPCAGTGRITSLGHNMQNGTTCNLAAAADTTNDAQLGPLRDNGGHTMTHALPETSPAIDFGGLCPGVTTDQRGIHRPQGAACDIGAFELEQAPIAGDVNCDGARNSIDAALVLQLTAGVASSLPCQSAGDVNGDGATNSLDAALILQFVAGLLHQLPPP